MQGNWSLILNILLLVGVIIAIGRLMKARRQSLTLATYQPSVSQEEPKVFDDIISVRKINPESLVKQYHEDENSIKISATKTPELNTAASEPELKPMLRENTNQVGKSLMMLLVAKENRQLAGYELLQTVLAAGLRFGEGNLFHRHQYPNGQGVIICSLATATASGVFDLQNIGAVTVRGLCLFMRTSGNATIDEERLAIMYETATQLSEGLDAHLLDDQRKPLTKEGLTHYYRQINKIDSLEELSALSASA